MTHYPADAPVLQVLGMGKRYGDHEALTGVDITVDPGVVHGLLGPNGSGKTSALHIVAGISQATAGEVVVCGTPIDEKAAREHIGFAPDDLPLPNMLTGLEYVRLHDRLRERRDEPVAWELAAIFGISSALGRLVGEYSHGMKRKLQLVVATMHRPDLLVLDEPFRGLDPASAKALRGLIAAFARSGRSVLMATHDMTRAEHHCARVEIVHEGRIVASGTPSGLIASHGGAIDLEDVFLRVSGSQSSIDTEGLYAGIFPDRSARTIG